MILHKQMFWSETTGNRRFEFSWRLKHDKLPEGCYVVVLARPESTNLLELYPAEEAGRAGKRQENLTVVGIARDKSEAIEIARTIIDTVYQKTGGLDVWRYFSENTSDTIHTV